MSHQILILLIVLSSLSCESEPALNTTISDKKIDQFSTQDQSSSDQFILDQAVPLYDLTISQDLALTADQGNSSATPQACDPLQSEYCTLPWPSDFYLHSTTDGQRFWNFAIDSLPQSIYTVSHNPQRYKWINGTGLYPVGMAYFPRMDWSTIPHERMIESTLDAESPIALVELPTANTDAKLIPCWGEADGRTPADQALLMIRPAQLLKEQTRYVYVVKKLKDQQGQWIQSSLAFASLRDGLGTHPQGDELISSTRRSDFEDIFTALASVGIDRSQLLLAWPFTTASASNLTGQIISMRDQAFSHLGDQAPSITIDEIKYFTSPTDQMNSSDSDTSQDDLGVHTSLDMGDPLSDMSSSDINTTLDMGITSTDLFNNPQGTNEWIAFDIKGHLEVPNFMKTDENAPISLQNAGKYPPRILNRNDQGDVQMNGTVRIPFWMRIPHSALNQSPTGIVIYGHGMLYSGAEVRAGDKGPVAYEANMIFMGVDLWGMSEDEIRLVPLVLTQTDRFPWIGDLLQQGILNTLFLARTARRSVPQLPMIQQLGIQIDQQNIVYAGISQGAIFGASILASSPDLHRGHLGVPGIDYFTLLGRSKNFTGLFDLLQSAYPDPIDQWINLAAIQLIWNQSDSSSFYPHLAQNLLTPTAKQVLLTPSQGDHQVAPITIEVLARSDLSIKVMQPYARTRSIPLVSETPYPHQGSAIVNWEYQAPFAPIGNRIPDLNYTDPHDQARTDPNHNHQMIHFWKTGEIIDVCNGQVCGLPSMNP